MSGGVRWRPGGGYLLPALIPPEPLNASIVRGKMLKEIRQMLVSGALDDTKTIGKVDADIFAKYGLEKN